MSDARIGKVSQLFQLSAHTTSLSPPSCDLEDTCVVYKWQILNDWPVVSLSRTLSEYSRIPLKDPV